MYFLCHTSKQNILDGKKILIDGGLKQNMLDLIDKTLNNITLKSTSYNTKKMNQTNSNLVF